MGAIAFLMAGFWMLMLFDCIRSNAARHWIFILIFFNIPGAFLYFLLRRVPYITIELPPQFRRWTYRKKIWDAEAAAKTIGKPHQFVNLGNILLEARLPERAFNAYEQALSQEPDNLNALWGLASISLQRKQYDEVKQHLDLVQKKDPDYKFGEASLAYGQALYELSEWDAAKAHLRDDVKRWSHPEAVIMLATIQIQEGDTDQAKEGLETMMYKLRGTPRFYFRKKRHLLGQAQRLLKQIEKTNNR